MPKSPTITLVLDNLRSCHNVGSILRTADGFGVAKVFYLGTTPYPTLTNDQRLPHLAGKQTVQIAKTALGAEANMAGVYYPNIADFLADINADTKLVSLEQTPDATDIKQFQMTKDIYLVVGNEVEGVSQELLDASQKQLTIPMRGKKESFNVAIATAIALYSLTN